MRRLFSILGAMMAVLQISVAQVGGASVYGQSQTGSANAQANERAKRTVTKDEMPTTTTSMVLDASILMNVKADEFVAVFGISQEGATPEECRQKMDATIGQFTADLKQLGVDAAAFFVDFVAQNRIYGFDVGGDVAREKLTGFELKKNVSIHYRDKSSLDKFVAAASRIGIFDLIKVDYVVKDIDAVHTKLMEDAARVIKLKAANHDRLLGIKLRTPQVLVEKYSSYFPTEMYDSYIAYETEDVTSGYYRQKFAIQGARKARTFYYNALNAKNFDHVLNPVVVEPMVQFSLYLKVKFEASTDTPSKPSKPGVRKPSRANRGRLR